MKLGKAIPRLKTALPKPVLRDDSFADRKKGIKKIKTLGRGAFGAAYSGKLRPYGDVVVKEAKGMPGYVSKDDSMLALAYEVRVLAKVQKFSFVPRLLEVGKDYFVMEDVKGVTALHVLTKEGMEAREILSVVVSSAIMVTKLHEMGVGHGDLYERNILLTPNGVVIIDFGMAAIRGQKNPVAGHSFKDAMNADIVALTEQLSTAALSKTIPDATKVAIASIYEKYRRVVGSKRVNAKTARAMSEDLLFVLSQVGAMRNREKPITRDKVKVKAI